jgi:hypothetical protein
VSFFIQKSDSEPYEVPDILSVLREKIKEQEEIIRELRLNNQALRTATESLGESNKTFNLLIQKRFKSKAS